MDRIRPHIARLSQEVQKIISERYTALGLPVPVIRQYGPSASCALLVKGDSADIRFGNLAAALDQPAARAGLHAGDRVRVSQSPSVAVTQGAAQ